MAESRPDAPHPGHPLLTALVAALLALAALAGALLALAALVGWLQRDRDEPPPGSEEARRAGHETSDMHVRVAFACLAILVVASGLVVGAATFLDIGYIGAPRALLPRPGRLDDQATPPVVAVPVLEAARGQELGALRRDEEALLHSYGWVDQAAGTVRVPIERAMDLVVARGLPSRSADAGQAFRDDATAAPSVASSGRVMEPTDRW